MLTCSSAIGHLDHGSERPTTGNLHHPSRSSVRLLDSLNLPRLLLTTHFTDSSLEPFGVTSLPLTLTQTSSSGTPSSERTSSPKARVYPIELAAKTGPLDVDSTSIPSLRTMEGICRLASEGSSVLPGRLSKIRGSSWVLRP